MTLVKLLKEKPIEVLDQLRLENIFRMRNAFQLFSFLIPAIFYAALIIKYLVSNADFSILNISFDQISDATANNYAIGSRVRLFYTACALFLSIILFISNGLCVLRKYISEELLKVLLTTSLWGIFLIITSLWGSNNIISIKLILSIHISLLLSLLLIKYFKTNNLFLNIKYISWHHLLALSFTWGLLNFKILFFNSTEFNFMLNYQIFFIFIFICFYLLQRIFTFDSDDFVLLRFFSILSPCFLLIPLKVVSTELLFIANSNGFYTISIPYLFGFLNALIFLFCIALWIIKIWNRSWIKANLQNVCFLVVVTGISFVSFYSAFGVFSGEMFERANQALPVQQFLEFKSFPFFHHFSSHFASDFTLPFFYVLFNGFHPEEIWLYDFVLFVIINILIFLLIKKITSNTYFSFAALLFFSFIDVVLPYYFSITIVSVLFLFKLIERQNSFNYFLIIIISALLIVWRIDIGFPNILTIVITLVLLWVSGNFRIQRSNVISGLLWAFGLGLFFLVNCVIFFRADLFIAGKDILEYLSSAQNFGLSQLTYSTHDYLFVFHYFILPSLVIIILFTSLLYSRIYRSEGGHSRNALIIIVFFSIFYFFNFQRGLVRHSFAEGWDTALSSFGFFTIATGTYYFYRSENQIARLMVFTSFLLILSIAFHFPKQNLNNNLIDQAWQKTISAPQIVPSENKIQRVVVPNNFAEKNYLDLKKFMDENFGSEATFIDFTNTPMLYYYLHKPLPNYFYQPLLSSHNEYLQNRFINQIHQKNIPVVLFSSVSQSFWDNVDGIPNMLRHYRISEYIYAHYKPYAIIGKYWVWLQNEDSRTNLLHTYSFKEFKTYVNKEFKVFHFPYPFPLNPANFYIVRNTLNKNCDEEFSICFSKNSPLKVNLKSFLNGQNEILRSIKYAGDSITEFRFKKESKISFQFDEYEFLPFETNIKHYPVKLLFLPMVLGSQIQSLNHWVKDSLNINTKVFQKNINYDYPLSNTSSIFTDSFIQFVISSKDSVNAVFKCIFLKQGTELQTIEFYVPSKSCNKNFIFRISAFYSWNYLKPDGIRFSADHNVEIEKIQFLKVN